MSRNLEKKFSKTKKTIKKNIINPQTSFVLGMISGLYLGELFNQDINFLRQTSDTIKCIVDGASIYSCGMLSVGIIGKINSLPQKYKIFKN